MPRRLASWLGLFFDLVFVVAIAELSHELVVNHTLGGFATFAALFVPVFVAWQGFSFYADRAPWACSFHSSSSEQAFARSPSPH